MEWYNISHYSDETVGTFEVVLYETGEIIFNYDNITYLDPFNNYTCGLNYGLDTRFYNEYQGLTESTIEFSIHFFKSNLVHEPSYFSLNVDVNDTRYYKITTFNGALANSYLGNGRNPENYLGPGAAVGAFECINITKITNTSLGWNITQALWSWTKKVSDLNKPPTGYYNISVNAKPVFLGARVHVMELGYILPVPLMDYLMLCDWYTSVSVDGNTVSETFLVSPTYEYVIWSYTYNHDGVVECYKLTTLDEDVIYEINLVTKVETVIDGGGEGNGDGGDDDDEGVEAIPGYDIYLILGTVFLISTIILIRRKKS